MVTCGLVGICRQWSTLWAKKYLINPLCAPEIWNFLWHLMKISSCKRAFSSEKQTRGSYCIIMWRPMFICGFAYTWKCTTQYYDALYSDMVIHMGQHVSNCTGMPVSHAQRKGGAVLGLHLHPLSCPKQPFQEDSPFSICSEVQHSLQVLFQGHNLALW